MPGVPPGDSPAMLSGYVDIAGGSRSLFYFLVHASTESHAGHRRRAADSDVPLLVWLQGGNGCSSMLGALNELGPFNIRTDGGLGRNPRSWHQLGHLLFLDRPAGAGFSFSRGPTNSSWANDAVTAAAPWASMLVCDVLF